jgi:hypothetical protein
MIYGDEINQIKSKQNNVLISAEGELELILES